MCQGMESCGKDAIYFADILQNYKADQFRPLFHALTLYNNIFWSDRCYKVLEKISGRTLKRILFTIRPGGPWLSGASIPSSVVDSLLTILSFSGRYQQEKVPIVLLWNQAFRIHNTKYL